MKVVLVFRDRRKKGKSIEGVFQSLLELNHSSIQVQRWEYNQDRSIFANVRELLGTHPDIIHITGDVNHLACFLSHKKVIITIHDVGRHKELAGIKKLIYGLCWIKWPIAIAKRITVVSQFTRADVVRLVPAAAKKIDVIHNGYSGNLQPVSRIFNEATPRILQVGTSPNKNIETLIRASNAAPYILVLVGMLTRKQIQLLESNTVNYEHYADLNEDELRKQYELADLVVFVSTHEGFGLPLIEAQAVGRPIITSRLTSIPEVAGEGAHYVNDPYDANELHEAIERICSNESYRNELITKGFTNIRRFSNDRMISSYVQLYEKVAQS